MTNRTAAGADKTFTVSELNHMARELLESALPPLWIEGEISNLSMHSSGHWYLTLKDQESQVRAAMFRNRNQSVRLRPRNGMHVRVYGRVSLYAARGDYQFILDRMEDAGLGALQRAFDALKAKLHAEGLFDPALKRPLPLPPRRIGLITSPTGAAVHDILTVLERRCPLISVVLYPSAVQGAEAPQQLIEALEAANRRAEVDVIILGRGGGSLEDLWAFNDERLARAIRASAIPVVSAVGHEVDFTIADFVADARAPTPSAAAELLSPPIEEWSQTVVALERRLIQTTERRLRETNQLLLSWQSRLKHPGRRLEEHHQRLDELLTRLQQATARGLQMQQMRLARTHAGLERHSPARRIALLREKLSSNDLRLNRAIQRKIDASAHALARQTATLDALSPLATLDRGYSILRDADDRIVCSSIKVTPGQKITARLAQGSLACTVDMVTPPPDDSDHLPPP